MINKIKFFALFAFLLAGLSAAVFMRARAQPETDCYLPVVKSGPAIPPPDEASARLSVPPGFTIRIFAQGLSGKPRFMAFGPDGQLYISLFTEGKIARLPDRNKDGLSDGTEIAASGLNYPHGIEFRDGWLYVAEGDRIDRLADQDLDGVYETKELLTTNIPGLGGHSTRTVHFGPDGKMYVSAGSTSNITPETDPRRAAILRFNPDGSIPDDNPFYNDPVISKRPLYAWGLRNSVDFLWTLGRAAVGEPQRQRRAGRRSAARRSGDPGAGGRLARLAVLLHARFGVTSGPEVRDMRVALPAGFSCEQAVPAIFTIPAHSAPLGMALAESGNFPAGYQNSLYQALHGSWNTTTGSIRDCKVERIVLSGGLPASSETFASGWRAAGAAVW